MIANALLRLAAARHKKQKRVCKDGEAERDEDITG